MKLGKLAYEHDPRSISLGQFLDVSYVPEKFDFDSHRAPFPIGIWGNDIWQNCVIVAQTNAFVRVRRLETRRSTDVNAHDVLRQYRRITKTRRAGDVNDRGLSVLAMLKDWNHSGFFKNGYHPIAAYGELDPLDRQQLREACYLLGGLFIGLSLPESAKSQVELGRWEIPESSDRANWRPGTWGDHLVYVKKFDKDNLYGMTWGKEIQISNPFIDRYCDEAWAIVNNLVRWEHGGLDLQRLLRRLHEIPRPEGG